MDYSGIAKPYKFTRACVHERHVNTTLYNECYHAIMNTEISAESIIYKSHSTIEIK